MLLAASCCSLLALLVMLRTSAVRTLLVSVTPSCLGSGFVHVSGSARVHGVVTACAQSILSNAVTNAYSYCADRLAQPAAQLSGQVIRARPCAFAQAASELAVLEICQPSLKVPCSTHQVQGLS